MKFCLPIMFRLIRYSQSRMYNHTAIYFYIVQTISSPCNKIILII
nr:MAG TPA: hypothetical protein [Caudoviricetes sp.]